MGLGPTCAGRPPPPPLSSASAYTAARRTPASSSLSAEVMPGLARSIADLAERHDRAAADVDVGCRGPRRRAVSTAPRRAISPSAIAARARTRGSVSLSACAQRRWRADRTARRATITRAAGRRRARSLQRVDEAGHGARAPHCAERDRRLPPDAGVAVLQRDDQPVDGALVRAVLRRGPAQRSSRSTPWSDHSIDGIDDGQRRCRDRWRSIG